MRDLSGLGGYAVSLRYCVLPCVRDYTGLVSISRCAEGNLMECSCLADERGYRFWLTRGAKGSGWNRKELALLYAVAQAPPKDLVRKETHQPNDEADCIPHWNEPQDFAKLPIAHSPFSPRPCQATAKNQISDQVGDGQGHRAD